MDPYLTASVSDMTVQSCYQYLLSENYSQPHCVEKFLPTFGSLYWSTTWRELFFFDSDRPVVNLNWKIAHGVLYTADRLLSFGYAYDSFCFCGHALETLLHLLFDCPLAFSVLSWLQGLMFSFSTRAPTILCRQRYNILFGWPGMTFIFGSSAPALLSLLRRLRHASGFICLFSFLPRESCGRPDMIVALVLHSWKP